MTRAWNILPLTLLLAAVTAEARPAQGQVQFRLAGTPPMTLAGEIDENQ